LWHRAVDAENAALLSRFVVEQDVVWQRVVKV